MLCQRLVHGTYVEPSLVKSTAWLMAVAHSAEMAAADTRFSVSLFGVVSFVGLLLL